MSQLLAPCPFWLPAHPAVIGFLRGSGPGAGWQPPGATSPCSPQLDGTVCRPNSPPSLPAQSAEGGPPQVPGQAAVSVTFALRGSDQRLPWLPARPSGGSLSSLPATATLMRLRFNLPAGGPLCKPVPEKWLLYWPQAGDASISPFRACLGCCRHSLALPCSPTRKADDMLPRIWDHWQGSLGPGGTDRGCRGLAVLHGRDTPRSGPGGAGPVCTDGPGRSGNLDKRMKDCLGRTFSPTSF